MNKVTLRTGFMLLAVVAAAGLFTASLRLPVWHLKMEAPQYQGNEALQVHVYPGSMRGDLREISVLNKYIGVRIPDHLPQLHWLPVALLAAAGLGLVVLALPRVIRSPALFVIAALLAAAVLISAAMAQWQMHRIGHDRDPHAALKGVRNFTPPILGRVKVANFEISTGLGSGALVIAAGILLQVSSGVLSRSPQLAPLAGRQSRSAGVPNHAEVVA